MRCIIYSPHWLRATLSFVVKSAFYIRTQAWGFRRCSFRQLGRCQSLYCVERVTGLAPRFYVYILTFCKTSQHGSHWQKTFAIWQYQVLSIEAIFMRYSMHEAKKQKAFLITSENCWGGVIGFSLLWKAIGMTPMMSKVKKSNQFQQTSAISFLSALINSLSERVHGLTRTMLGERK